MSHLEVGISGQPTAEPTLTADYGGRAHGIVVSPQKMTDG